MPDAPPGPELGLYQFELGGFVFGDNTAVLVDGEVTGLFDSVMRLVNVPLPRADGSHPAPLWAEQATIIFPLRFLAPPHSEEMHNLLVAFEHATASREEMWLRWRMAFVTWRRRTRVTRRAIHAEPMSARMGAWPVTLMLTGDDPRYYSDVPGQVVLRPFQPGEGGGWELPTELPLDASGPQAPAPFPGIAHNAGTDIAWPTFRLTVEPGNVQEVHIYNRTTGVVFHYQDAFLPINRTLVVDFDAYMRATGDPIVVTDGSDRFGAWQQPRVPFGLVPGDNILELETYPSQDTTCTVEWLSTWL